MATEFPNPSSGRGRRKVAPLTVILVLISIFFCGILIWVWVVTKRVHPVMLDLEGKPLESHQTKGGSH